jgi:hypothetical protein
MLVVFQNALDTPVDGTDGNLGALQDLLFDCASWDIRYLVIDTGSLLGKRHILLVPGVAQRLDWDGEGLATPVTQVQANKAPSIEERRPLSRQKEFELARHFGWQPYWQKGPAGLPSDRRLSSVAAPPRVEQDDVPYLLSAREVIGFDVKCAESDVGYAGSLVFDDRNWMARYLVVDVGSLLTERRILVALDWLKKIDWDAREIRVDVGKMQIEGAPEFDLQAPIDRAYEERLHDHYDRSRYWE